MCHSKYLHQDSMIGLFEGITSINICSFRLKVKFNDLFKSFKAADAAQRLFVVELDGLAKIGRFLHPTAHRPSTKVRPVTDFLETRKYKTSVPQP